MKKILLNFADEKFRKAQKWNSFTGKLIGSFDSVIECSPEDIDEQFRQENEHILAVKRGAGAWLWKPYFILRYLKTLDENDILFYSDAGAVFCRNTSHLIESMKEQDIWVSDIPLVEAQWTKPSVFTAMDADSKDIKETAQIQAPFIIVRKTQFAITFLEQWLNYCCNSDLLLPDQQPDTSVCIAHREDQSILSVLCKKWGIQPHQDPTQFSKMPDVYKCEGREYIETKHDDSQKVTIIHYRDINISCRTFMKLFFVAFLPNKLLSILRK